MTKQAPRRWAIIDADTLLYTISLSAEMCAKGQGDSGSDLWFQVRTIEDCFAEFITRSEEILDAIDADEGMICLSDPNNFRYDVYPKYKSNRARTRKPAVLRTLVDHVKDHSGLRVLNVPRLEADDVVGITSTTMRAQGRDAIMVSADKDLLTIPGVLYRQGRAFEITEEEADRAHMYQTLIGDHIDGYPGCRGVGPKTANKILDSAESPHPLHLWRVVLPVFVAREPEGGQKVAVTMAQVARILRNTDWDPDKQEVRLWQPPM
jgi:DNA polymerase-1